MLGWTDTIPQVADHLWGQTLTLAGFEIDYFWLVCLASLYCLYFALIVMFSVLNVAPGYASTREGKKTSLYAQCLAYELVVVFPIGWYVWPLCLDPRGFFFVVVVGSMGCQTVAGRGVALVCSVDCGCVCSRVVMLLWLPTGWS